MKKNLIRPLAVASLGASFHYTERGSDIPPPPPPDTHHQRKPQIKHPPYDTTNGMTRISRWSASAAWLESTPTRHRQSQKADACRRLSASLGRKFLGRAVVFAAQHPIHARISPSYVLFPGGGGPSATAQPWRLFGMVFLYTFRFMICVFSTSWNTPIPTPHCFSESLLATALDRATKGGVARGSCALYLDKTSQNIPLKTLRKISKIHYSYANPPSWVL